MIVCQLMFIKHLAQNELSGHEATQASVWFSLSLAGPLNCLYTRVRALENTRVYYTVLQTVVQ